MTAIDKNYQLSCLSDLDQHLALAKRCLSEGEYREENYYLVEGDDVFSENFISTNFCGEMDAVRLLSMMAAKGFPE